MDSIVMVKRVAGQRVTGLNLDFSQAEHVVKVFMKLSGLDQKLQLRIFSDDDKELLESVENTGKLWNRAKLVIAKHGAAESNVIFMQRDSMVCSERWMLTLAVSLLTSVLFYCSTALRAVGLRQPTMLSRHGSADRRAVQDSHWWPRLLSTSDNAEFHGRTIQREGRCQQSSQNCTRRYAPKGLLQVNGGQMRCLLDRLDYSRFLHKMEWHAPRMPRGVQTLELFTEIAQQ
jgi:hypothetical protein